MDILVRLATEAPDLSGMPAELADLAAACLERVPRDRPTEATILDTLGSFTSLAGSGHSYLPDSAMALIAEYQHDPASIGVIHYAARDGDGTGAADEAGPDDAAGADWEPEGWATDGSGVPAAAEASRTGDSTSGSHTALPGFELASALHAVPAAAQSAASQESSQRPLPPGGGRRWLMRPPWLWAEVAGAAVVLLAAGAALGIALHGSGTRGLGPLGPPPPSCAATQASNGPQLCVSQPTGDGDTVFVLEASGFSPFAPVTVSLANVDVSPYHLTADMQGTFSYAIDQGHYFFPGQIPAGSYTAVVTSAAGTKLSTSFQVHPPITGPPPGYGPPPGDGAQGGGALLPRPPQVLLAGAPRRVGE